jgi:dipeptidase D
MVTGRRMINIDTGDEGKFVFGSAGGINSNISLPISYEPLPADYALLNIQISGLQGGHSGVEIHKGRANAHLLLARTLTNIRKKVPFYIANLKGGDKRNVITREASAVIAVPVDAKEVVQNVITEATKAFLNEYADIETEMVVSLTDCTGDASLIAGKVLNCDSTNKVIALIMAVPNDVMAMHNQIKDLVGTSCNLGSIELDETEFRILSSIRSSHQSKKDYIVDKFESIAGLIGADFVTSGAYPSWEPNVNSNILKSFKQIYEDTFTDKKPIFEAVHAGLECGFASEKFPGIDIISCGPTMEDIHSPKERLYIDTNLRVMELLLNVMLTMKE